METSKKTELFEEKIKVLEDTIDEHRQKISLWTIFSGKASGKSGGTVPFALLSNLINASGDGVIAADKVGNLLIFNDAATFLFGYTTEDALLSLNITDLYPENGAREVMAKLRSDEYGGPGKLNDHLIKMLKKDGSIVTVRMNASIIYENETEIATIGYLRSLENRIPADTELTACEPTLKKTEQDVSLDEYLANLIRQLQLYDQQFCVGALKNNMVTAPQIKKALHKQFEIAKKTKVHVPIGRIMIQLKIMTEKQRDAIVNMYPMESHLLASASLSQKTTGSTARQKQLLDDVLTLDISEDGMQAAVRIKPESGQSISLENLLAFLKMQGIIFGIRDDTDLQADLDAISMAAGEPFIVAHGQPPVAERLPVVRYHVSTETRCVGITREDGTIDWKNRGKLPQIRAGDILADIAPGSPFSPGRDVRGREIKPPAVKSKLPKCGKGVTLSAEGTQYLATVTGLFILEDNKLSVVETLMIEGDVGLETGHIDFDGHVEVSGSIRKGYRVNCKSLQVEDVDEAEIMVAGDMMATGGIFDSTVKCKGGLQAYQIRKSEIRTGRDLVVKKEIMEASVESSGQCLIEDGTIIFSQIIAKDGVVAGNLGTKGSKPSTLLVGIDQRTKRDMVYTKKKLEVQKKELERLPIEIEKMERQLQDMEVETTDLSKNIDFHSEQITGMEKQLKRLEKEGREADARKTLKIINNLISEKKRIKTHLQSIEQNMEKLSARAVQRHSDVENGQMERQRLEKKLASLIADGTTHAKGAVVRVKGSIYAGTTVTGPRTSLTISDDLACLSIKEGKRVDEQGRETMVMQMSSLK